MNFLPLDITECAHTFQHLVEIYLMSVELRTVYTYELGLPAYGDAARAAHARSVHHDGIERHIGRNLVFLSEQADELHHDCRPDSETLVHLLAPDDFFHAFGH